MPDIDLEPNEYRPRLIKPLDKPKYLWWGIWFYGLATLLCVYGAYLIGAWWSYFLPIPTAVWFGISVAGMWPGSFFGKE